MEWTIPLLAAASVSCLADVTLTIEEVGSDVVMSGGGTLDTSMWTYFGAGYPPGGLITPVLEVHVGPGEDDVPTSDAYAFPANFQGPTMIGEGRAGVLADIGTGHELGLAWFIRDFTAVLFVPLGYVPGEEIDGDATFLNHSFESIGLAEGSYTWTWDTADGAGDSFTVHVGPAGCDADVNGDGELNVLDFVAFQQLWQTQDPAADCDADAEFNVLDFVCFQQLFQAGCD